MGSLLGTILNYKKDHMLTVKAVNGPLITLIPTVSRVCPHAKGQEGADPPTQDKFDHPDSGCRVWRLAFKGLDFGV